VSVLEQIVAQKHEELMARRCQRTFNDLRLAAEEQVPTRDFSSPLRGPGLSVIAEIKRRSPAKGDLNLALDPAEQAARYERAGASAISVLTDEPYFKGSDDDLVAARRFVGLPVLRKDFTLHPFQVYEARALGADAILLIARCLGDGLLRDLRLIAESLGMAALVEVHDETELERALASEARVVGINNRDLDTLEVDPETSLRLRPRIPAGIVTVSESGIARPELAARLREARFDAILVGEALVTAPDPEALLAALRGERSSGSS
jgi:indole-3-glycerol phosphate synthase